MTIVDGLLVLLIVAAAALCIYLIISLKKLNQNVSLMQQDIHSLIEKTIPVIDNLNEISERAVNITSTTEYQVNDISEKINNIKNKISHLTTSLKLEKTENQVMIFLTNLRAAIKGLSAFLKEFKK